MTLDRRERTVKQTSPYVSADGSCGGGVMAEADLVFEDGGVKGIALVGAIEVLEERGYQFKRVAGTSAGAIIRSLGLLCRRRALGGVAN